MDKNEQQPEFKQVGKEAVNYRYMPIAELVKLRNYIYEVNAETFKLYDSLTNAINNNKFAITVPAKDESSNVTTDDQSSKDI